MWLGEIHGTFNRLVTNPIPQGLPGQRSLNSNMWDVVCGKAPGDSPMVHETGNWRPKWRSWLDLVVMQAVAAQLMEPGPVVVADETLEVQRVGRGRFRSVRFRNARTGCQAIEQNPGKPSRGKAGAGWPSVVQFKGCGHGPVRRGDGGWGSFRSMAQWRVTFVSENRMSYVVGGDRQKALSLTQNLVLRHPGGAQASIRLEPLL